MNNQCLVSAGRSRSLFEMMQRTQSLWLVSTGWWQPDSAARAVAAGRQQGACWASPRSSMQSWLKQARAHTSLQFLLTVTQQYGGAAEMTSCGSYRVPWPRQRRHLGK